MHWVTPTKPWIFPLIFGVFIFTTFYIGEYNKSMASWPSSLSYTLVPTEVHQVPLYSSSEEQSIIKGMVITEASTQNELIKIALHIKKHYAGNHVDSIELTIHNRNNGWFEDETMLYEPISKGTIFIAYTPLGHTELQLPKHEHILVQLNN